jgi:hypothetical protein
MRRNIPQEAIQDPRTIAADMPRRRPETQRSLDEQWQELMEKPEIVEALRKLPKIVEALRKLLPQWEEEDRQRPMANGDNAGRQECLPHQHGARPKANGANGEAARVCPPIPGSNAPLPCTRGRAEWRRVGVRGRVAGKIQTPSPPPLSPGVPRERGETPTPKANGDNGGRQECLPHQHGANGDYGRDRNGRFTKGNPGGPGNPFTRRIAEFRRVLCTRIQPQDLGLLAQLLLERAQEGDMAALKLLLLYTVGRPAEPVNPDLVDLNEWQHYVQMTTRADEFATLAEGVPLQVAMEFMRTIMPFMIKLNQQKFVDVFCKEAEQAEGKASGTGGRERKQQEEVVGRSQ